MFIQSFIQSQIRKHESSASLAFVRGNHRWLVNSPQRGPVTRKMFPFGDVIMIYVHLLQPKIPCITQALVVLYGYWQDQLFSVLFISLHRMFVSTDFSNNGLNKSPWTTFVSNLPTKLSKISIGVPVVVTDSPWGVWDGWTTCLVYDGLRLCLCLCLYRWQLVCMFRMV